MLKTFKFIALLEGISLLVLLFIAMPLKYWLDKPEMVSKVGMAHGVLFILYIVMATVLKNDEKWSWKKYGLICIASVIPFGTFVMEKKLLESKA
ncbi:DUF3817 domain-containing protein [Myroides marinus]|uniref:Integral membrane protein n=1 Tax=Myroides marinus TaxID=703342 RepID=A0A165RDF5_9FLAO|nr:DUF3817 domain-containing protein [Myroides marinus]KZE80972.1 hypothetical protein AV926_09370 [Myroides marinus]MDM1369448.1 DUF3817 domain-containing protein [Myroides marinus]MDM1372853.1 DUF3817 domain-containing protein [Myroides marinus]MDM1375543.1 DUF3817 domain-containing protein [Myroides marinus]MDM1377826.1 DUF3817 domain-containing protein [Myroides marinus]